MGGESAEQRLIATANRSVAFVEAAAAHRGGTEVDWEQKESDSFTAKLKAGIWSPDVERYRTEMEEKMRVVAVLVPPCP